MSNASPVYVDRYADVSQTSAARVSVNGSAGTLPPGSHRAAYITTTNGARWLQIGVVLMPGKPPRLYLEASGREHYLGAAVPGRSYAVALTRSHGRYVAWLDGRQVGALELPVSPTVAALEGYGVAPRGGLLVQAAGLVHADLIPEVVRGDRDS